MTRVALAAGAVGLLFAGVLACSAEAQDPVPQTIKVQGFLSDRTGGNSLPADGVFTMMFGLHGSPVGGPAIMTVGPFQVDVRDGVYSVELPFPPSAFSNSERYLEVTVAGETLSPRIRLASTPFAYVANRVGDFEGQELEESAEIVTAVADHATAPGAHASLEESAEIDAEIASHESALDPHDAYVQAAGDVVTGPLVLNPGSGDALLVVNGNMGIGTPTPQAKLDVQGNVRFSGSLAIGGPGPWRDVRAFGAVGDGASDDAAAIQAAIGSIDNGIGGTVYFPPGAYRITSQISLDNTNAITLAGAGPSSFIRADNLAGSAIGGGGNSHLVVRDLRIGGTAKQMVFVSTSSFVTIERCDISGATSPGGAGNNAGIELSIVGNARLLENTLSGNGLGTGQGSFDILVDSTGTSTQVYVRGNHATSSTATTNIALYNSSHSEVSHNHVANAVTYTTTNDNGYGILLYNTGLGASHNQVIGNRVSNTGGSGIYVQSNPGTVVQGNIIENVAQIQTPDSLLVAGIACNLGPCAIGGNFVRTSGQAGIAIAGDRSVVTGNVIENATGGAGILVNGNGASNSIAGNTIKGSRRAIFAFSGSITGLSVVGNTVDGTSGSNPAIHFLSSVTDSLIAHNLVMDAEGIGIALDTGSARCIVQGNLVKDSGRETTNTFDGIFVTGTDHLITHNQSYNSTATGQRYGIAEGAGANNNEYVGNNVRNNESGGILLQGQNSRRADNVLSTSPMQGQVTLDGGRKTVPTAEVQAGDFVQVTRLVAGGTLGHLSIETVMPGSFEVISSSASDTSTVAWKIVH